MHRNGGLRDASWEGPGVPGPHDPAGGVLRRTVEGDTVEDNDDGGRPLRRGSGLWAFPFSSTGAAAGARPDRHQALKGHQGGQGPESWRGGRWLCVVGKGFIHVPALAVIVEREKKEAGEI